MIRESNMAMAPQTGAVRVPRGMCVRSPAWTTLKSGSALFGRAQVLGGQPEPGSGEVLEGDTARHLAARSVRAVPVQDERSQRSAGLDGCDHRRPRIMRGGEPAQHLV